MRIHLAYFYLISLLMVVTPELAMAKTIEQSISEAIQTHPAIKAAKADAAQQEQNVKEVRANYFPTISVQGNYGRTDTNNDTSRALTSDNGAAQAWTGDGRVAVIQRLYDGRQTGHQYGAEKLRHQSSELRTEASIDEIALRAVEAHLNVMRIRDQIAKTDKQTDMFKQLRERIAYKVELGAADETSLLEADEFLSSLQARKIQLQRQYQIVTALYQEAVGNHIEDTSLLEMNVFNYDVPPTADEAITLALQQHPAIKALELNTKASVKDMKSEKSALSPVFDAELSYFNKDTDETLSGEIETAQALVKMNWSFSSGGAYQARVERMRQKQLADLARLDTQKRDIRRQVYEAYHALYQNEEHLSLLKRREDMLTRLLAKYQNQFDGGRVSILQIMDAENSLMQAALEHVDAYYTHHLSQYQLLAAMGQLRHVLDKQTLHADAINHVKE